MGIRLKGTKRALRGIMLFEVLIALSVLAIGITAALTGMQRVLAVTKRSRDMYDARLVSNDEMFRVWALSDAAADDLVTEGERTYDNKYITLHDTFTAARACEDVEAPEPELAEEDALVTVASRAQFQRIINTIKNNDGILLQYVTLHAFPNDE